ncbi:DUF3558 domain-containing protein [Nocardia vermiculata]|uniref:DUF3558 domain-containing protein n=1 Tax=Nocardia vermiculata TaxID=257274 RepID=A0A846XXI1_9NOCA|nr:DUF3558 domain-containing protein [Nocardia vermiculata]NKY50520.1 DUF3558 domain-containing protein [Nocardia vermiculata]
MKRVSIGILATSVVLFAAACSTTNDSGTDESTQASAPTSSSESLRPTLTASKLQPPSQDSDAAEGRPEVVFDPCTWISDKTISDVGYDPSSRHRIRDIVAEDTFLTCGFSSPLHSLRLNSGNVTWDQNLQKNAGRSDPTTVNGREAMWVHDPDMPETCELDLRTKVGFVQVLSDLTDATNASETPPCDGLLQTAEAVENEIGKDN